VRDSYTVLHTQTTLHTITLAADKDSRHQQTNESDYELHPTTYTSTYHNHALYGTDNR